jgi:hypothetical protein
MMHGPINVKCKPFHSIFAEKMRDLSDAVMPTTAPVTFRNRDPDGTDTYCLSSGITLICSDQRNTSLMVERNVTDENLHPMS